MNPHVNPELRTGMTACPIPPSQEELNARRDLEARLARENSPEQVDLRVAALEREATELRAMNEQPVSLPSPEVIAIMVEAKRQRRGF
jgi:hypothetical protein